MSIVVFFAGIFALAATRSLNSAVKIMVVTFAILLGLMATAARLLVPLL